MELGIFTESLPHLKLDELLKITAELGFKALEFGCGNWSKAPHLNLNELIKNEVKRRTFLAAIKDYGFETIILNCSGNQLAPGKVGRQHNEVVYKTFRLAKMLGVNRIVMMSGCPGGPGDANPNWIITDWPPQIRKILKWQWEKVAIPYWRKLVSYGKKMGVTHICVELHGGQLVYNTETMLKLRDVTGEIVGCNFDPSHMMWMGGNALAAVSKLGSAIYHVHIKDTWINPVKVGLNTLFETKPEVDILERSWNFVTPGYGHSEKWWSQFLRLLNSIEYNGVLSIEQEDLRIDQFEGVKQANQFLQRLFSVNGMNPINRVENKEY